MELRTMWSWNTPSVSRSPLFCPFSSPPRQDSVKIIAAKGYDEYF